MSREDQYNVTVTIEGLTPNPNLGTFDKFAGGEVDSEESTYPPGGMAQRIALGGRQTVGNVTVGRLYDLSRDHSIAKKLMSLCGKANMTVTKQPLTVDGVATGVPLVYTGKLKRCTPPDHDSESSSPAIIELEMSSATVA